MPALRALLAALLLTSCVSQGPPPTTTRPALEEPFLARPLLGYPLTAGEELTRRVTRAWEELVAVGDLAAAEAAGQELAAEAPGFHPAQVLLAQVDYLENRDLSVIERLSSVVDELPDYTAAQILLARAADRAGDLPRALVSYSLVAARHEPAARRAAEIRPRAVEIVFHRLRDEIDRGRVENAEDHLEWLTEWAGDSRETLEGSRLVAVAKGDAEAELAIVRRLVEEGGELADRERLADLELEIGDVEAGLEQLEALVAEHPAEPRLAEQLERAKFLWRLQLLPPAVQAVGRKGEIDRADLSTLLYWLVPQVRYSQVTNPPIATDILDHPRRDEILRVLNLGLMQVDETLHRFGPGEPATRRLVFEALLTLLESSGRELSCLRGVGAAELGRSRVLVCRAAAHCRLIPEEADCLPAAAVSGAEVLEHFRLTLGLLGAGG